LRLHAVGTAALGGEHRKRLRLEVVRQIELPGLHAKQPEFRLLPHPTDCSDRLDIE